MREIEYLSNMESLSKRNAIKIDYRIKRNFILEEIKIEITH